MDEGKSQSEFTIVIPEKIKGLIQKGVDRVAREIIAQKPELIVVLDRSATLLWPAIKKRLPEDSQEKVVFLNIGIEKVMPYNDKIGGHLFVEDKEEFKNFLSWVVQQGWVERTKEALGKQKWDAKRLVEIKGPVFIVDDLRYGGVTGELAVFLLKQSLGKGADIRFETVLPHGQGWLEYIIKATFPDVNWKDWMNNNISALRTFLIEVTKGSITDSDNPLLTSKITLEEAFEKARIFVGYTEGEEENDFKSLIPETFPYRNNPEKLLSLHWALLGEVERL